VQLLAPVHAAQEHRRALEKHAQGVAAAVVVVAAVQLLLVHQPLQNLQIKTVKRTVRRRRCLKKERKGEKKKGRKEERKEERKKGRKEESTIIYAPAAAF
jgi:hypothetical protein